MTEERDKNKIYELFEKIVRRTETSFDERTMSPDDFFHDMKEMKEMVSFMQELAEDSPQLMLFKDMSFDRVLSGLIGGLVFWNRSESESNAKDAISDHVRKELDRCVEIKIPPRRYWCFLYNFDMEQETYTISKTMRIRKATLFEKAYLHNQNLDRGWKGTRENILEVIPNPSYPKTRSESEKIERISENESINEIEYFLTSLRLLNPCSVGVNWVIRCNWYGFFASSSGLNIRSDLSPAKFSRRWKQRCIFDTIDWKLFSKIYHRIEEVAVLEHEEVPRVLRILRRYNRAICSEFVEDEIIDLWIILETISRKIGTEASSFISEITTVSTKDRQTVKNKLDYIYRNIRNPIFHGGSFDFGNQSYVDYLFSVTSNALRAYLVLLNIDGGFFAYVDKTKSDSNERKKLDTTLKEWLHFDYINSIS